MSDVRASFGSHVDHLIAAIPHNNSTIDLQALFFKLTLDSATAILFGESTHCLLPDHRNTRTVSFAKSWTRAQVAIPRHSKNGFLDKLIPDPIFKADVKLIHDFVDGYVRQGLAYRTVHQSEPETPKPPYVFLHALVQQTTDPVQIRSELLNILVAGRDTTASLLSNVWWTLARRRDIWVKLRVEVDGLGGREPTFADIKEMKYLTAVLKECPYHSFSPPPVSPLVTSI